MGFHICDVSQLWWFGNISIQNQQWYMLTVSKRENDLLFYYNSTLIINQPFNGFPISNTANVRIGGPEPGDGGGWQGKLDDIGVWNRALTESEIQQLYNE